MQETTWKIYQNSEEVWEAMLEAISSAKYSIDLEQYIFENDSVGNKFIEALKNKAREGLKIRIICDEVGSFNLSRSNVKKELETLGIKFKFFNSIVPWSPNKQSLWYFRNHRKLLVVDGTVGFTGGICLGEEMTDWRESNVRIEGLVVKEMQEAFEIIWTKKYYRGLLSQKNKKLVSEIIPKFHYLTNSPLPGRRYLYKELIKIINKTEHYLYMTTPYFLPDHRISKAIKRAIKRGVEVRILLPLHPNHFIIDIGARTFFDDFLRAGVKIFRHENMIHSKTIISDGLWSTVGSLNLDNVSLRYNFEANLVSIDKRFAFDVEKQFTDELTHSTELTLDLWRRRPLKEKILEWLVWPVRKLL